MIATLTIKRGIVLDRWAQGLSVMLEKIFGCSLITKLRSILLMEADFNAANKTIYGVRMLANARKYHLIPEEIFSERNRLADDGTLSKVIFYDIARQLRRPMGLASVDADNCYDRICHPMASMVFQSFGVSKGPIRTMLKTLQDMRFFLRTGYGDSSGYVGGNKGSSIAAVKKSRHEPRQHGSTSRLDGSQHPNDLGAQEERPRSPLSHPNFEPPLPPSRRAFCG
jgi:hypothetical protein